jgi:hypothetical protein
MGQPDTIAAGAIRLPARPIRPRWGIPRPLTTRQCARELGVTTQFIRSEIERGHLTASTAYTGPRRIIRVYTDDWERYLVARKAFPLVTPGLEAAVSPRSLVPAGTWMPASPPAWAFRAARESRWVALAVEQVRRRWPAYQLLFEWPRIRGACDRWLIPDIAVFPPGATQFIPETLVALVEVGDLSRPTKLSDLHAVAPRGAVIWWLPKFDLLGDDVDAFRPREWR